MKPSKTDCAWAAGIVDGEGCIAITARCSGRTGHWLSVQVAQSGYTKPPMLTRLQELFGGSISGGKDGKENRLPTWKWIVGHATAESFLKKIHPYLIQKTNQADVALAFRTDCVSTQGKRRSEQQEKAAEIHYSALKKLHKPELRLRRGRSV